jgi:hypothetical protein
LVQLALLIFVSIAVIFTTSQTAAASTAIADLNTVQVTPPTSTPTPTVLTPTLQPDIDMLLKTLLTQELSSVDRVVLTTELERILDELAEGQSQISVEYDEDDNEEEKTVAIIIAPIGLTAPIEETEEDNDSSGNGDNGNDDPTEEPPVELPVVPPFG